MKITKIFLRSSFLISLVMLISCADDELTDGRTTDDRVAVSFNVSNAQDDAQPSAAKSVRFDGMLTSKAFADGLAMQDLTPEDLVSQKLAVIGGESMDACLIETTVAGVNPVQRANGINRANISKSITDKFSSIGYRGTTEANISDNLWFYNSETAPNGTLVNPVHWDWSKRYAKFYGIYPQVIPSYAKLTLSPENHNGIPYVEFEVEEDVTKQKDLMTACSGIVHYALHYVAPETNLKFRHALTAVRFKVGQNLSWNKHISKVEILNAKGKGRYVMATDSEGKGAHWEDVKEEKTFTLNNLNVSTSEAVNNIILGKDGDNYVFYMIPQELNNVKVRISFKEKNTQPITANLSGEWKAGTTKTYALSQKSSDWTYNFTVEDPNTPLVYTDTKSEIIKITSFRSSSDGTQQPVAWKVLGYDKDNNGKFSMDEKPDWLSLNMTEGAGGASAQEIFGNITPTIIDNLALRNKALQDAQALGSKDTPYDLSTKGGNELRSTANSYVISAPGHYRIPLVYGNAITKNKDNRGAYTGPNTNDDQVLKNFLDHAGMPINDPWITRSNSGSNTPDGAKLVWADEKELNIQPYVSGTGTDAYVNFEVTKSAIKNGNAVIAVTKNGTIVWSWHLWFAPQSALETTEVTNLGKRTYNFINETLGFKYTLWSHSAYKGPRSVKIKVEQMVGNGAKKEATFTITQNDGSQRKGYATYYQFGRKDAFPGINQSDIPVGSYTQNGPKHMTIAQGIQNPGIFYTMENNKKWDLYQMNLWSVQQTSRKSIHNNVKSVYDPSPAGFKIPPIDAFTSFTKDGSALGIGDGKKLNVKGGWDNGWDVNNRPIGSNPPSNATIYFHASGYHGGYDGTISLVNEQGYYWTASPNDTRGTGTRLQFSDKFIDPNESHVGSYGMPVRPVAE